jgi:hypothetical protein
MQILELRNNNRVNVNSLAEITLWNFVQNLLAWTTITPIVYIGARAGSEFETYLNTKVYLCLEFDTGYSSSAVGGNPRDTTFYNMLNVATWNINNSDSYWEIPGARIRSFNNNFIYENFYFSRLIGTVAWMKFIGYRLTV